MARTTTLSDKLADFLEVWGVEKDFLIFADGSAGFGIKVQPADISCWDDDRINHIAEKIAQFLNGLPPLIDLQFVQEIRGENGAVLDGHMALSEGASDPLARNLAQLRVQRLRGYDRDGILPAQELYLLVRRPFTEPLLKRPKIFSSTKSFEQISEAKLAREISETGRVRENILQGLKSLGVETWVISSDVLLDMIYAQWNPGRHVGVERPTYDPEDLRSSLVFTDVALAERGFSLADWHYKVITLKSLPDQTYAGMAAVLRGLPFRSTLFLSIQVPDQHKELEKLQTQRRIAFSMARGKRTGVSDIESESKFQDLETLLEQMIAQGEKVFRASLHILLKSKSQEELEQQVSETLMRVRELGGAEAMEETVASFDLFAEFSLPNGRARERAKHLKSSNLADFVPLFGPWPGHAKPSILMRSRAGSLVSFDPFASDLTNYNHIVSGGSGSGKSFLTNILLLHMLKENPKIFIVDIGGSYKKLCENLSGQYIPLGIGDGLSLNPFDLGVGEGAPSNQKIKFLVSLVELMTKEDEASRLPKLELAEIEEAIQRAYDNGDGGRASLSRLQEILLAHNSVEIRRFGRILAPWCGNTPYGKFVDAPTNIELTRPIVVFDLKGMESYPDLQAIALFIITDFVWRQMQEARGTMKFLVFDECWRLLENESGLSFIEEVFRTFRKYFAGAIAISQNIDDFAKSKIAGAILSNSAMKWILMQKGADQKRLEEVLQLNPNEMSLIGSLRQERGVYSEAFLIAGDNRSVVAIESTPLEYWIATTDPRDLAVFENKKKENPSANQLETLQELAEKFPRGVANA